MPIFLRHTRERNCSKHFLEIEKDGYQYGSEVAYLFEISKASEIAHSFISGISLFCPKNILLSFHSAANLSSQQTEAAVWLWYSFDLSVQSTKPGLSFLASSIASFLFLIIISSLTDL